MLRHKKLLPNHLWILPSACLLIGTFSACSTHRQFHTLYAHYFPKHSRYLDGDYRRMYDAYLFGPRPKSVRGIGVDLYDAFYGDEAAAHRFFNSSYRGQAGEYGLGWYMDCLLLLIRLGDVQFAKLLEREDRETREFVGVGIEDQLEPRFQDFPKTRALYNYRYSRDDASQTSPKK